MLHILNEFFRLDYLNLDEFREFFWMLYERDTILEQDWMGDFVFRVANKRQSKKYVILKKLENEIELSPDELKFMLEMERNNNPEEVEREISKLNQQYSNSNISKDDQINDLYSEQNLGSQGGTNTFNEENESNIDKKHNRKMDDDYSVHTDNQLKNQEEYKDYGKYIHENKQSRNDSDDEAEYKQKMVDK